MIWSPQESAGSWISPGYIFKLMIPSCFAFLCIQGSNCCSPTASAKATCNSACFSIQSSVRKQVNPGTLAAPERPDLTPSVVFYSQKPHKKKKNGRKKHQHNAKVQVAHLRIAVHSSWCPHGWCSWSPVQFDKAFHWSPAAASVLCGLHRHSSSLLGAWLGSSQWMLAWPRGTAHRDGNELRRTVGLGTKFWEENQKIPRLSWQTLFEVKGISKGCSASKKLPFSLIVLSHLVTQKKAFPPFGIITRIKWFPSNDAEFHEWLPRHSGTTSCVPRRWSSYLQKLVKVLAKQPVGWHGCGRSTL